MKVAFLFYNKEQKTAIQMLPVSARELYFHEVPPRRLYMIETLNGRHETVNYVPSMHLKLYYNRAFEHYPQHWHVEAEIIAPVDGEYTILLPENKYVLRPGDIIFICPGVLHELPESNSLRIIFQIDVSLVGAIRQVDAIMSMMMPYLLITKESMPLVQPGILHNLNEIKDLYCENVTANESSIYARFLDMIPLLLKCYPASGMQEKKVHHSSPKFDDTILKTCSYISQHCSEDLPLDKVADFAGFSKYHFERMFRRFTGQSYYQYLTLKRITFAKELLANPSITITDVAFRSGFSNGTTFTRAFRKITNSTPSEFRLLNEFLAKNTENE